MRIFLQKRFWLRAMGVVIGAINLIGSEAAWETGGRAEPARYLVAAIVLFLSGIYWLAYSFHPKLELSNFNYKVLVSIMLVGPFLGLLYSFKFYGGECGFTSKYGYPGYWLNNWRCTYTSSMALWEGRWSIDYYSLIADLFFWSGVGLLLSLLWGRFKSKPAGLNS